MVGTQTGFLTQSVPQPKSPPGFRNAAPSFDCTVRSLQPHSPCVPKVMLAWISIQYVTRTQDCSRSQVCRKSSSNLYDWYVCRAKNLCAGKASAVGVDKDIPIGGRSGAIEVYAIGVDRVHIPSLAAGYNEVVSKIGARVRKIGKRRRQGGDACIVVVLIVKNCLHTFRPWWNADRTGACGTAASQWKLRNARQGRSTADVIAKLRLVARILGLGELPLADQ